MSSPLIDDPRMLETISCVQRELTVEGLVCRYLSDEGLMGREGIRDLYFWLVSCLAKAGMVEEASALFEQVHGFANDLGLLAEEIDPASGEQLGNFPQAFSHVGLINAAHHIDEARDRP